MLEQAAAGALDQVEDVVEAVAARRSRDPAPGRRRRRRGRTRAAGAPWPRASASGAMRRRSAAFSRSIASTKSKRAKSAARELPRPPSIAMPRAAPRRRARVGRLADVLAPVPALVDLDRVRRAPPRATRWRITPRPWASGRCCPGRRSRRAPRQPTTCSPRSSGSTSGVLTVSVPTTCPRRERRGSEARRRTARLKVVTLGRRQRDGDVRHLEPGRLHSPSPARRARCAGASGAGRRSRCPGRSRQRGPTWWGFSPTLKAVKFRLVKLAGCRSTALPTVRIVAWGGTSASSCRGRPCSAPPPRGARCPAAARRRSRSPPSAPGRTAD